MRQSVLTFSLAIFGSGFAAARGSINYSITDLGALGGINSTGSFATAINNSGMIVGYYTTSGTPHPFVYSNGTMRDLVSPTILGKASAINDLGDIAGTSSDALIYTGTSLTSLGDLGGVLHHESDAYGVNHARQVVGRTTVNVSSTTVIRHAFVDTNATMTDLFPNSGAYNSQANAINDSGQIVGYMDTPIPGQSVGFTQRAFLYSNGSVIDLSFGSALSEASAINGSGQVVGYSMTGSGRRAFLYDDGATTNLGTLYSDNSAATGINSNSDVVGNLFTTTNGINTDVGAFIYTGGTMLDLNTLLPVENGWTLKEADGINDSGQVVGYGINPQGQTHAFLMTVVPEPGAIAMGAVAAVPMIVRRRRRLEIAGY